MYFADNFQEFVTLKAVYEEIFKLHIFIESMQEYFFKKRTLIYKGRCGILFCYLFWFHARLVHVTQHDFVLRSESRQTLLVLVFELLVK